MKTIRKNCFETNSSSTHSFSIITKKDFAEKVKEYEQLYDATYNTLYPSRLEKSSCFRCDNKSLYDSGDFEVVAKTKYEKAALFLCTLAQRYNSTGDNRIDVAKQRICAALNIKIENDISCSFYLYGSGEAGGKLKHEFLYAKLCDSYNKLTKEEIIEMTDFVINEIILNDDVIIQEGREEY